nr:DUF5643 domain-containing protein [Bacillus cereus]
MNVTSLAKVEGKIRKFTPNIKTLTKENLYALAVDKVNFSSLSTRIDLTFDYSKVETNDSWPVFDYTVTDDKGKIYEGGSLQVGSTGLYGHHFFGIVKIMATTVGETVQTSLMINLDLDGYPYLKREIKLSCGKPL